MPLSQHKRALRISIDLGAIRHNLDVAKVRSGGQKLFAVIKADAYGHGAVQAANALDRADAFAVVTVQEAVELRDAFITKPILVLQGAQTANECAAFSQYKLWPVVHCMDQVRWFKEQANATQLQAWIKIDSGMGRLGFQPSEAERLLNSDKSLKWHGALTHFASADDLNHLQTEQQIQVFSTLTKHLNMQKSLANSAGILAWPTSKADWARPGVMLYGSSPVQKGMCSEVSLRPAMRVSAPLISIKHYDANDTIGYAASYVCPEAMDIGYVAIGYGDGLPRLLDQSASVYLNGLSCPIVGRVSMDSIAIDLRGVDNVQPGVEVILWGPEHPIEKLAAAANTISYELMTSIRGQRDYK